jgi:hypothetical protein
MARLFNVTMHAKNPRRLASFWSAVLGYPIVEDRDELVRLRGPREPGAPDVLILKACESHDAVGRLHLDLAAQDLVAEVAALIALGSTSVDGLSGDGTPMRRSANGIEWVVLADPEGNEFCVGSGP